MSMRFKMLQKMNFDKFLYLILVIVFTKLAYLILYDVVQHSSLTMCFGTILLCFLWLSRENIKKISFYWREGFAAELEQIKKEKDEIIALKENMRDVSKQLLQLSVEMIESGQRVTWDGFSNYHELINSIKEKCKSLNLSDEEQSFIFSPQAFWKEKDKNLK